MAVPVVASTTPATGATSTDPRDSLSAVFSTALLSATVTRSTVYIYETATGHTIDLDVALSADGLTITVVPRKPLREEISYTWALVGNDVGAPGGHITSSDGDALAASYVVLFRTTSERFVSLAEITDRDDIERVGPIRSTEDEAAEAGYLSISSVVPAGFATNQSRSLSTIEVDFGEAVLGTGSGDALTLVMTPADGYTRDYGYSDATGSYLMRDVDGSVASRVAAITDPVGTVAVTGSKAIWTKDSGYTFPFNAEITVQVHSSRVANSSGYQLDEDTYFSFTTTYWPVYASPTVLRIELGPTISSMYDDTLYRIILKNSVRAILESNDHVGTGQTRDYVYGNTEKFVKAQSVIDVVDQLRLLADIQAGQHKTLGDFSVKYDATNPLLIAKRQEALKDRERALRELRRARGQGGPKTTVQSDSFLGERADYGMRSWDSITATGMPTANTSGDRSAKKALRSDHPTLAAGARKIIVADNTELLVQGSSDVRVMKLS